MSFLFGDTVPKRKKCLAELVQNHLQALGHEAKQVENRMNSAGHTDQIVIDSSLGLIHLTASSGVDPNGSILAADYKDGGQAFLADKQYVAFGWNTNDERMIVVFVPAAKLKGKECLTKSELKQLSERTLNKVFTKA